MRRTLRDGLMSAGALIVLLLALVSVDDRVREQFSLRLASGPSAELRNASGQVRHLTSIVVQAARDQSIEHAPLVLFVLAAIVLVLFMLRN
jgi:hypothetical protein